MGHANRARYDGTMVRTHGTKFYVLPGAAWRQTDSCCKFADFADSSESSRVESWPRAVSLGIIGKQPAKLRRSTRSCS